MYPPAIASREPDAVAYVMSGSGAQLTYQELDERSNALAHLMRHHGIAPGDSLVLFLPNHLAWPVVVAAGMRSGLLVTPLNWHIGASEVLPMLEDSQAAVIVTAPSLAPIVREAVSRLVLSSGRRPLVLCVDGGDDDFEDLEAATATQPTTPIKDELLGARVLFSGGTTGRPRPYRQPLLGVHPLDAPARHPGLAHELGIGAGIRLLSPAPSYHAAPFTFQLMTLSQGGAVVCMERFDAVDALGALNAHRVTHSQWVPTMLSRLAAVPRENRPALSSDHRVAVTSGAPCPSELKDTINDWWGDILHEYYGASEGYGHTYISPAESRVRRGSVGRPLGAARVAIVGQDGMELPSGEVGKVCFAQPDTGALKGMGDMGKLDEDGYLYLTGRATFMIISGGVNIYPEEVEAALMAHPAVADAAVFGVPHPDFGEQVAAVIELAEGFSDGPDLAEELIEHCRERIAAYKAPRRVEFVDEMPRLPTGKLNKRALQQEFKDKAAEAVAGA